MISTFTSLAATGDYSGEGAEFGSPGRSMSGWTETEQADHPEECFVRKMSFVLPLAPKFPAAIVSTK
jgi:hypothetical protein